ncbi:MAG: hypothetical protein HIU82_10235 [Proteobacteria bacterium]|nr:hypothetical protein [Pseudomonadota bacterium]
MLGRSLIAKLLRRLHLLPPRAVDVEKQDITEAAPQAEESAVRVAEIETAPLTPTETYQEWFRGVVGRWVQAPNTWPATSWMPDTPWGARIAKLMVEVEHDYASALLETLDAEGIRGPIVEFGVFQGDWLRVLLDACESRGYARQFIGFDSFQGLPVPSAEADLECFVEGQFSAGLAEVSARLEIERRDNLLLVPGWFADTLPTSQAATVGDISFARVDCDLYAPALECLRYLGPRLADGAVLVLDDWTFDVTKGETCAFMEWRPEVPALDFEFLCFNGVGHLYLRVRNRPIPDDEMDTAQSQPDPHPEPAPDDAGSRSSSQP